MSPWVIAKRVWGMRFATLIFRESIFFYSGIKQLFQVFLVVASPYNSERQKSSFPLGGRSPLLLRVAGSLPGS